MLELISLILNALFGGGLIISLATLKSTRKQAKQDTDKSLVDNFNDYIVSPLKSEVNELRKSVNRLNRAISKISSCPHASTCPVRDALNSDDRLQDAERSEASQI